MSDYTVSWHMSVPDVHRVPVSGQFYPMTQEMRDCEFSNLSFLEQSHVFVLVSHRGYSGVYVYRDAKCNREIEDWNLYPTICEAVGWVMAKYYG